MSLRRLVGSRVVVISKFLLALALLAFASVVAAAPWDSYDLNQLSAGSIFSGLSNVRTSVTGGEADFMVTNPTPFSIVLGSNWFSAFAQESNRLSVSRYEFYRVVPSQVVGVNVTDFKWACVGVWANSTNNSVCSWVESGWHLENTVVPEKLFSLQGYSLAPGASVRVKIKGFWKAAVGVRAVDWVPSLNLTFDSRTYRVFSQREWAWWDASWMYKFQSDQSFALGSTVTSIQIPINFSSTTQVSANKMFANLTDVRVTNGSENTEFVYYVENSTANTGNSVAWALFDYVKNGNNTAYVYYGNNASARVFSSPYSYASDPSVTLWEDMSENTSSQSVNNSLIPSYNMSCVRPFVSSDAAVYGKGLNTTYSAGWNYQCTNNARKLNTYISGNNTFLFELVFKKNGNFLSSGGGGDYSVMYDAGGGYFGYQGLSMNATALDFTLFDTGLKTCITSELANGNWYHVVLRSYGATTPYTYECWVNGVMQHSGTWNGFGDATAGTLTLFGISGRSTQPILTDSIALFNSSKSSDWVIARYQALLNSAWTFGSETTAASGNDIYNVTLLSPANSTVSNNSYLNVSYAPYGIGKLVNCTLFYNTSSVLNASGVTLNATNYFNQSLSSEGFYDFNVTCFNDTGSKASEERRFTLDNSSPVLSLSNPVNGSVWLNSTVYVNGTVSDANLLSITTNSSDFAQYRTSSPFGFWNTGVLTEGNKSVLISANDSAGNAAYVEVDFIVDRTAPNETIVVPTNNSWLNAEFAINVSCRDVVACGSFGSNASYFVNDSAVSAGYFNLTNSSAIPEGWVTYLLQGNDTAQYGGNVNLSWLNVGFDSVAPVLSITAPLNNSVQTGDGYFINATCVDGTSGCDTLGSNCSFFVNDSSAPYSLVNSSAIPEGWRTCELILNDSAGNRVVNWLNVLYARYLVYSVTLLSPANVTTTYLNQLNVSFVPSGNSLKYVNCSLNYNGTVVLNASAISNASANYFNVSLPGFGWYFYVVSCWSGSVVGADSEMRLLSYIQPPVIWSNVLLSPANGSSLNTSFNLTFEPNASVLEFLGCDLLLNGTSVGSNSSAVVNGSVNGLNVSYFYSGGYYAKVRCFLNATNYLDSNERYYSFLFVVSLPASFFTNKIGDAFSAAMGSSFITGLVLLLFVMGLMGFAGVGMEIQLTVLFAMALLLSGMGLLPAMVAWAALFVFAMFMLWAFLRMMGR